MPKSWRRPCVLKGHEDFVNAVAISFDGRWLVTGSYDNTARLRDLKPMSRRRPCRVLKGHNEPVNAVAISADSRWLVTGSGDNTAGLWDLSAEEPENTACFERARWLCKGCRHKLRRQVARHRPQ